MPQMVKNPPATQKIQVQSLGWEDPLQEKMATHSGILAWKIPGQRSLVGYSPWRRKESDMTEQLSMHPQNAQAVLSIHSDGLCLVSDIFRPFIFKVSLR